MTFFTIISRGLLRRPVRTGLTLVGISIGIAAVVALVGISRGFEQSWAKGMQARGTDIVVSTMGSGLAPKPFDAAVCDRVAAVPGVADVCPIFVDLTSIESSSMMIVSAREWGGFTWRNLKLLSGRMPNDAMEPVVLLGRNAAEVLEKKLGDPIQIDTGTDGCRHRRWRRTGGKRFGDPFPSALSGHFRQSGQINVIDVRALPAPARNP